MVPACFAVGVLVQVAFEPLNGFVVLACHVKVGSQHVQEMVIFGLLANHGFEHFHGVVKLAHRRVEAREVSLDGEGILRRL